MTSRSNGIIGKPRMASIQATRNNRENSTFNRSLETNSLPTSYTDKSRYKQTNWGTPPRITALHSRSFRRDRSFY